jgi:magnesium chelatase family protein
VEILRPKKSILSTPEETMESSANVRERVIEARNVQLRRTDRSNALLENSELAQYCHIDGEPLHLLEHAAQQFFLSPRACHRILKVSRTIADQEQSENIRSEHIAEAITFRRLNAGHNNLPMNHPMRGITHG